MRPVIASGVIVLTFVLCDGAVGADSPDSYRSITVHEFETDGSSLAAQSARVQIAGAYAKPGTVDLLYANTASARDPGPMPSISLLTDQASHGARAALLDCRSRNDVGCMVKLRGQVTMCTITKSLGSSEQFACLDVRDGGLVSSQVSPELSLLERAGPATAAVPAAVPESTASPPESKTPLPAAPVSNASCYGYVGFVANDGRFAVQVVGPFSSPCEEQFNAIKNTVPSPFEGGRLVVSDHGNARNIAATVKFGLHCEAVGHGAEHDPRGLTGIYECLSLGH